MDTQEPLEPLPIDDRSPGERWVQQGRSGITRIRESGDRHYFGTLALLWMLLTLLALGAEIYSILRFGNPGGFSGGAADAWTKALLLAEVTAGFSIASMVGVGLAALAPGGRSRAALLIAVVIGGWTVVVGIAGVAAAFHGFGDGSSAPTESKFVESVRYLADGGLGLVVIFVALRLRGAQSRDPAAVN